MPDDEKVFGGIERDLQLLAAVFACSFVFSTSIVWYTEVGGPYYEDFGDVVWWWLVTSTTVGFGDYVPVTTIGRLAGAITIIVGIYGYTHTISLILQNVQEKLEEDKRGLGTVETSSHVLVFEYTAFADELIREIDAGRQLARRDVVIASSLIGQRPYTKHGFINGEPIAPDTQERANTSGAGVIFVFANSRFTDPDLKTLHVASRVMRRNQEAPIYVELEDPDHPLLDDLPRPVHVMPTRKLLESSIRHEHLDMDRFELSEDSIKTEQMPALDA